VCVCVCVCVFVCVCVCLSTLGNYLTFLCGQEQARIFTLLSEPLCSLLDFCVSTSAKGCNGSVRGSDGCDGSVRGIADRPKRPTVESHKRPIVECHKSPTRESCCHKRPTVLS